MVSRCKICDKPIHSKGDGYLKQFCFECISKHHLSDTNTAIDTSKPSTIEELNEMIRTTLPRLEDKTVPIKVVDVMELLKAVVQRKPTTTVEIISLVLEQEQIDIVKII